MNLSRSRRSLSRGVVAAAVLLGLSTPALAHGDLESSKPEAGSTIKKSIDTVTLTFTEEPLEDARVRVFDGCRQDIVDLTHVVDRTMHILLTHKGEPGKWKVEFKVVSAVDGHESEGSFGFTVKGKADCSEGEEPSPGETAGPGAGADDDAARDAEPTSDQGSDFPMIAVLIGALALIGIAVLAKVGGSRN
jgi:methionine-rich copper-binding protein CopC